jgi:hypothetical protein
METAINFNFTCASFHQSPCIWSSHKHNDHDFHIQNSDRRDQMAGGFWEDLDASKV